ncbi:pirin family protein [Glaciecola sp. 2405UD65-10]|uniref:pirin family protein n=1 Tax=Glaciecola sp. 2405UD65-10 TaxID=3397244 RepID=UPI003B5A0826
MSSIKTILKGKSVSDGAGVKLKRIIGQAQLMRLDPFLLLDEFGSDQAQDYIAGFPAHPHRGFQTVTYMLAGKMQHKDSVGNTGIIEDGGVQWMNAGRGIIHEEMPMQTAGTMRGFQLWLNLPASEKMSKPAYQDILSAQINEISIGDKSHARVIAGRLRDVEGAVKDNLRKTQFYDMHMNYDDTISFRTCLGQSGFIYVYEGSIVIAGRLLSKGEIGVLNLTEKIQIVTRKSAKFIFLSGQPINEPIEQYGPFVMNTKEEIQQAILDFQAGAFS